MRHVYISYLPGIRLLLEQLGISLQWVRMDQYRWLEFFNLFAEFLGEVLGEKETEVVSERYNLRGDREIRERRYKFASKGEITPFDRIIPWAVGFRAEKPLTRQAIQQMHKVAMHNMMESKYRPCLLAMLRTSAKGISFDTLRRKIGNFYPNHSVQEKNLVKSVQRLGLSDAVDFSMAGDKYRFILNLVETTEIRVVEDLSLSPESAEELKMVLADMGLTFGLEIPGEERSRILAIAMARVDLSGR